MSEKNIIPYDVHEYQSACQLVRDAKKKISKLPKSIQEQVKEIAKLAVKGTYLACTSIYDPTTDPKKVKASGSESDFETDKKELSNLENLFS